ncbi:TPA: hypothetical protein R6W50_002999 [Citrobacter gillenii]|nr:hypothetical protein [Citrobacter gillenii]
MNRTNDTFPRWLIILILIFIVVSFISLGAIVYYKSYFYQDLSKYLLLIPPAILSVGFSVFYKRFKVQAEWLFSFASAVAAICLCVDSLSGTQNDLFPLFFQSGLGYILLVIISALSFAKIISALVGRFLN